LTKAGYKAQMGQMIDASFVEVPVQRNSREENDQISNGNTPDVWKDKPSKLSQKDVDARWTKKNNESYYGYKNHVKVDTKSKIITKYKVTDASVHDSQVMDKLLTEKDRGKSIFADSAYAGAEKQGLIEKYGLENYIHGKGCRNKKLTRLDKKLNKLKSKIRCRVEHIFGFIENSMNGNFIRTIGTKRAETNIGLINLVYNMMRYTFLMREKSLNLA